MSSIADLDIWRAANILIKQHGAESAIIAAQRADALLEAGDMEGQRVWKRIAAACAEMLRRDRANGEPLN